VTDRGMYERGPSGHASTERSLNERGLYERAEAADRAEHALSRLCTGFRAGGTDLGELLLYSGAAGLGKTSMINELRKSATGYRDACLIMSARGGEQQLKSAFHVVRQLFQTVLAKLGDARWQRDFLENWYDRVAPALGLVAPSAGTQSEPQGVRDALDWVATQLAVNHGPLVLIVDDLHWADRESLDWLTNFIGRLPGLPVLMALAFRPEELPAEVRPLLTADQGALGSRLQLRTLGPASVERMVRQELGADADDLFCRECWSITAGNPFDMVSLIGKMQDRHLEPVDENVSVLRELVAASRGPAITRRLEKLGSDTHRFAYAAAILDSEIDPGVCARIAGLTPAAAHTAMDKLREERLLREEHTAAGRTVLEFVHPTIATAVYQTILSPSIRTAMHGKAAQEVIDAGLGMAAASRHLLEIYPEDDLEVVRQLRQAADEHLGMGAPEAAKRCLERALEEPPAEEDRADVLFELGRSALLTDLSVTINHLRSALSAVPGLSPERREEATLRLGQALGHSNQMDEAAAVTAEEIERTAAGPSRLRLQAAFYMWRSFLRADPDGPGRSAQLAELSGSLTGTDAAARAVRVLRAWDLTMCGAESTEALALAEHAFDGGRLADGIGWTNTTWGFEIPMVLGLTYIYNDRLDLASQLSNDAVSTLELSGWSGGHLAFANFLRGMVLFRWGRLDEAERFLRDTLRRSDRLGRGTPLQWDIVGVLMDTLLARGSVRDAADLAAEYSFGPPYPPVMVLPDAPTLHGRLLLAQGRAKEAAEQLAEAGRQAEARGWGNTVWAPWAGHLALAVAEDDPLRARELAAQMLAGARRTGTNSAVGTALRMSAAVAEPLDAPDLLRRAVDRLGKSPAAYEYALALVDQGAALRRVGRPREAIAPLEQGVELAAQCAADGLVLRGRSELVASGASPHRLQAVAARVLNEEERRAAELAARRLPIQRIAELMDVSETVASRLLASAHRKIGTGPEGLSEALGLGE
jgi:tetratricopeptide (TPR) repeat protein